MRAFKNKNELVIPRALAHLEDRIFENLPADLAKTWPERFLEAVNVGAKLELVWPKFAVWMLIDETHGVIKYNNCYEIQNVANIYKKIIAGEKVLESSVVAAASAANVVAAAAAVAVVVAADAVAAAAYAAAYAACNVADAYANASDAADAADAAAAAANSKKNAYITQSEKLLEILSETK